MKRTETVDAFLSEAEKKRIITAIQEAERHTSGEIRVHLEERTDNEAFDEAVRVFQELEMHNTQQRNAALILLIIKEHRFAIIGDEGINKVVPANFWDSTAAEMRKHFKKGDFVTGLERGVLQLGQQLKAYFPYVSGDKNELSDEISNA